MNITIRNSLAAFLIILALAARLIPGPRTIDDAYITFRYARNLLDGQGFVFNPGEPVLGTTTPLYTLLMAGLGIVSGRTQAPFPLLALGLNALADAATCLLIWQIGRKAAAAWPAYITALIWAVAPYSVTFAIGGLETSIYVLLLTASVLAYLTSRRKLTALFAALALLTRPDALLLIAPLALDRLVRAIRNKEPIQTDEVLIFVLPVAAWYGFAWVYFGSPLPQSIAAKLAAYRLAPASAFIRLLQHYATPFLENDVFGSKTAVAVGLILYPFLFIVGGRRVLKTQPRLLAYMFYPLIYLLAFSLPNPLIFRWYLTPLLPAYFFFIVCGAGEIITLLAQRAGNFHPALKHIIPVLFAALPILLTLNAWSWHPDHGLDRPAPEMAWYKLELLYRQVADLLLPELTSTDTLAAGDVGVLGYYTPARILDTVGLNSPQPLRYYPLPASQYVINYAIPADLIIDEQPDWVVILEVYGRNTFLKDPRFLKHYTLRYTLPSDIYGSQGMMIWQRRP
jgi:hypothetical protein